MTDLVASQEDLDAFASQTDRRLTPALRGVLAGEGLHSQEQLTGWLSTEAHTRCRDGSVWLCQVSWPHSKVAALTSPCVSTSLATDTSGSNCCRSSSACCCLMHSCTQLCSDLTPGAASSSTLCCTITRQMQPRT